jgi:hypothetical protein
MTPPPPSSRSNSTAGSCQDLSFCIVWSPLPPITWIVPFIGHTGIANSRGIASDFQGPYFVGTQGRMAFGPPTRALKIDIGDLPGVFEECEMIRYFESKTECSCDDPGRFLH